MPKILARKLILVLSVKGIPFFVTLNGGAYTIDYPAHEAEEVRRATELPPLQLG